MEIAVIGTGYVGLNLACLADFNHTVNLIGRSQDKINLINQGVCPIYEPQLDEILLRNVNSGRVKATTDYDMINTAEVVFVCVGTPSLEDGSIDLSQIKEACKGIGERLKETSDYKVVVVKSTVVPGTTKNIIVPILEQTSGKKVSKDFGVCMNPEFLREGSSVEDFLYPDKVVIGSIDDRSSSVLERLYSFYDSKIPRIKTDLTTAEMIKYAQNSMLASRISFINEIANICENYSVDVNEVAYAIGLDPRIGPNFLKAGAGFGGSCFPKDVRALVTIAKKANIEPEMLNSILKVNEKQPLRLVELARSVLEDFKNKRVAILGLAFKPDTDDMREAPSIKIINSLLKEGAKIKTFDPKAMENAKQIFGDSIKYCNSLSECLEDVDCIIIVTEWKEFRNLESYSLKCPIVDGRRILDPMKINEKNAIYKGIGWKGN